MIVSSLPPNRTLSQANCTQDSVTLLMKPKKIITPLNVGGEKYGTQKILVTQKILMRKLFLLGPILDMGGFF